MHGVAALVMLTVLVLVSPVAAQERAGVVTTLQGHVTVMRASLTEPAPLKFKDEVFVRDRIATGKDSVARILLGGRAVVTVRERSVVTITEAPGVSSVQVGAGRAAVAVAREKMRPGDLVEVKTPNAVAGIRGTVIVAEVVDADHSVITVLKGVIDVKRLVGGQTIGPATILNALQQVFVTTGIPLPAPRALPLDAVKSLGQEFRLGAPRATPPAVNAVMSQGEIDKATKLLADVPKATPAPAERRTVVTTTDDDGATETARQDPPDKPEIVDSGLQKVDSKAEKPEKIDKLDKVEKVDKGGPNPGVAKGPSSVPVASSVPPPAVRSVADTSRGGHKGKDK
jgi:hypothetical protein